MWQTPQHRHDLRDRIVPLTLKIQQSRQLTDRHLNSHPSQETREDPSTANITAGNISVYNPVAIGTPAILVYPITSGIPIAANTMPAMMSFPIETVFKDKIP